MANLLINTTVGGNAVITTSNIGTYALTSIPTFDSLTSKSGGTGTYQTSGDFRAPIFYDSANTGYYGDFASTSNLYKLQLGGGSEILGLLGMGASYLYGMGITNAYTAVYSHFQGNGVQLGSYNGTTFTPRLTVGNDGNVEAATSLRAPIFYDSNDTTYYGDFAGTSNLYNLSLTGAKSTYLTINPGNGYEAMVRYIGGSGSSWYVGKRMAGDLVNTASFHFYSEAAGATVAGIDTGGNFYTTGSLTIAGTNLTGAQTQLLKNTLDVSSLPYKCDIYVEGNADTFYPVHFIYGNQDVWRRIVINRGYSETAPWDPIGTGVHHGGLLLDWEGNFGGWGGAEYSDRLRVFNESYTNVCADMFLYTHSMGYVFMLRGGHSIYHIFSDQPINGAYQSGSPDIAYSTATLFYDDTWSGNNTYDVYAPAPLTLNQVNSSRIDGLRTKKQSLLDSRYLRQGVDISGISYITSTNFLATNAFYLNSYNYYLNATDGGFYSNVQISSATQMKAPIYYDLNNTAYYGDFASTSVMNSIRFGTSTNSGTLSGLSDWGMRLTTSDGYIQFGPANSGYAHIYTDRSTFYFNRDLLVNGNTVLTAANYNSYAPTLTGSGASGNWGINITGSASALGQYTQDFQTVVGTGDYLIVRNQAASKLSLASWASIQSGLGLGSMAYASTGSYQPIENQRLSSGDSVRFAQVYNTGWFRNDNNNTGLYNETNGNHFYSRSGTQWAITSNGSTLGSLAFYRSHESVLEGLVYFDTDGFGLLNRNGSWAVRSDRDNNSVRLFYNSGERIRTDSSGAYITGRLDVSNYIYTPGAIMAKNIQSGYQVLNLDTIKEPGLYQYDGGIGGTQPVGTNWYNVKTIEIGSSSRYSQFVMPYSNSRIFYRIHLNDAWQSYVELITSGNIGSQSVSYATTAGALSSMNISQFTNNSGYITGYTETDTLNSVTGRGNTTSNSVRFGSYLDISPTTSAFRFYDGTTFRGGFGLDSWGHSGSDANLVLYVNGDNTLFFSTSGTKRASLSSSAFNSLVALQQSGNQVLHAGNYTSYSPSLTGSGASGTWGINVTGSAGSISGFNNPTTASTANTIAYRDASGDIAAREFVLTAATVHTVTPSSIVGIYPTTNQVVKFSASAVQTFLGLGSLAYSSATIPTNNNQLTNGAGYITSSGSISGTASNITAYTINQSVGTSSNPTFATVYTGTAGFGTGNNQWTWSQVAHQYQANSIRLWDQYSNYGGSGYPTTYGTIVHITGRTGHLDSQLYLGESGQLLYRSCFYGTDTWDAWQTLITSSNIGSQSVSYASTAGALTSMNISQFTNNSGYLTSLPSHNHDDRYLVKGGGWYGVGLPGSRWGGFTVNGGEIVFGDGLPNAGQMGMLIDGAYLAGENNGFWSLPSDNSWSGRRGMYWNGTYLDFTANSPTAQFTTLRLANGFEFQQGGSDYGRFSSWVHLNGYYGLYSGLNGAHIYPNNGSYGSWQMLGSRNGWQGIEFGSGSNGGVTLMINADSNTSGFHNNSYGWQFRWYNGTLYCHKNAYGAGTEATVLDSSNYSSWAQPIASAINTSNIGSQSVSYATTAGTANAVAWTNVSSRPTALSQFTNDLGNYGGWITGINSGNVTTALGFTPYNATNPSGYITSSASISGNAATATYATTAGSAPNGSNINSNYDVTAGVGNGLRFWNGSSAYKISMGVGALYQYGPVTDYSIKAQMNDGDATRGFTWGRESYAPIAALNSTSGDMEVAGYYKSYGYRSNSNVGGVGSASWHPDGIYCGSTMWQYGSLNKNNTGIYNVSEMTMYSGPILSTYNTRNLIVRALDNNFDVGILGQKSGGGFAFQIYGDGSNYGFLGNTWGSWDLRKTIGGVMYMNNDTTYYLQTNSTSNFVALNIQGNAVVHAGNIGSQSVSYATTAGSAGSATTAGSLTSMNISQFTNNSGYITGYTETDTLATVTGRGATFSSNIISSNGAWIKFSSAAETDTNDGKIGSGVFASGLNIVGAQTSAGLGRQIRLWGSVITSDGYTFYHSGNIPTWNQNTTGSAATATSATQLSTYGTITSDNWNTYFVSGQLIASSVSAHSGSNRPSNHYDYGAALSYGVSGGALWQMYFPENSGNSAGSYRNMAYRTGWNGTWGDWRSPVNQIGQVATVAGSNGTGVEIHSNVGYNQDPLTYFLMRGQADSSWKSFKIRLTGDAGGQDIEFRRIAENSTDSRMFYVPRGTNQVIFDYAVVTPSDSRLKDNLTLITTPVEKIKSLRGVEFDWNSGEHVGTHDVGLIAQDVEAVLPEAVTTQEDGYKNLAYTKVIPLLVEAMKEQQTMIEALRAEIELLKNR